MASAEMKRYINRMRRKDAKGNKHKNGVLKAFRFDFGPRGGDWSNVRLYQRPSPGTISRSEG